jgi:6-phosphogluconolactonase
MDIQIHDDAAAVARAGAEFVARAAREAIAARGTFLFAVSGGHTPWEMMRELVGEDVAWDAIHLFQVDERIAPAGDPDRNLTHPRRACSRT